MVSLFFAAVSLEFIAIGLISYLVILAEKFKSAILSSNKVRLVWFKIRSCKLSLVIWLREEGEFEIWESILFNENDFISSEIEAPENE